MLDLRGNGGGLLNEAVKAASVFIPEGPVVSTDGRTRPRHVFKATGDAISTKVPVVVLVDEGTASAAGSWPARSRIATAAKLVGTRTFGKGVFQEIEPLDNGGALDITVGEYFTPSGKNLGGGGTKRGAGLAPNVVVRQPPRSHATRRSRRASGSSPTRSTTASDAAPARGGDVPRRRAQAPRATLSSAPFFERGRAPRRSARDKRARPGDLVAGGPPAAAAARSCAGSAGPTSRAT